MKKRGKSPQFDVIGYWSEIKLDIVKEYAKAYSTILIRTRKTKALSYLHRRVCWSRNSHF